MSPSTRSTYSPRRARIRANSRWPGHIAFALTCALPMLLLQAAAASALDFQVDFRESTYQTQAGDTFSDLLLQHESEILIQSTVTPGLEDISTAVFAGGVNRNYSMMMRTTVDVGVSGRYVFQVGTDWGRGGAAALIDDRDGSIINERVIIGDTWWANDFNHPDVFTTTFDLNAGDSYTLAWVGYENCCGGSSTVRFSVDGGGFMPLTDPNFSPFVAIPEPSSALLISLGMLALGIGRKDGSPARLN